MAINCFKEFKIKRDHQHNVEVLFYCIEQLLGSIPKSSFIVFERFVVGSVFGISAET